MNGEQGERGQQGTAGKAGEAGQTGAAGRTGDAGAAGRAGRAGDAGDAGATGIQGEKGYRGAQGYPGNQGNQGFVGGGGAMGPVGERGATGKAGVDAVLIGRRALVTISVLLLLFVGGVGAVLSVLTLSNRAAVDNVQDLREGRVTDIARADVAICEENNRQDAIITAILRSSVKTRELDLARPALTDREKALVRRSIKQLVQQDCTNLPSSRPFAR